MAIASGLSPLEVEAVAEDDLVLFDTWRRALAVRWDTDTELLAGIAELQHNTLRSLAALGGAKAYDIPKPLRIPRPGSGSDEKKRTATGAELAAWVRTRRS